MDRIPIIIDVDTGTDDSLAITAALLSQDRLDIRGFSATMGNVGLDRTSRNTLDLVTHLTGNTFKVAKGASKPLARKLEDAAFVHGKTGLGDVTLPEAKRDFYAKESWDFIHEEALACHGELQILAVGPLTNIALTIQKHPDVVKLIKKITIMGGVLQGGNANPTAEFNIYADPEAAKLVFASGIPLRMIGLDVTHKPQVSRVNYEYIKSLQNPYAQFTAKILNYMMGSYKNSGSSPHVHDVIALYALLRPQEFVFKNYYMTVECSGELTRGMTIADYMNFCKKEANVEAAVDINSDSFWNWFIELLQGAK